MVLLHENKPLNFINRGGGTAERTNHCIILLTTMHEKLTMRADRVSVSHVSDNVCKKLKKTGLNKSVAYILALFLATSFLTVLPRTALVV